MEINTPKPLDMHWFPDMKQHGTFESYIYLAGNSAERARQKELFLLGEENGGVRNPTLDYPLINRDSLDNKEDKLSDLREWIFAYELNPHIRDQYYAKIDEKIAEAQMLKATLDGDMERFKELNEQIYGRPSEDIYTYTIGKIRARLEQSVLYDDMSIAQSAANLLSELPEVDYQLPISLPDSQIMASAHQDILDLIGDAITIPEDKEEFHAEEIAEVFQQYLDFMGASDWKIEIDPNRTALSVSQEQKTVYVPETRVLKREEILSKLVHEMFRHVGRRIAGESSQVMLLGIGLDHYEAGEEGVAVLSEQALKGLIDDFTGEDRHLAISLTYGLDGTPRDFRGTYEIMEKYYRYQALSDGKSAEDAEKSGQKQAWDTCVRTFRGTDCKTPGVCLTKDMLYREGNIRVWGIVNEDTQTLETFGIGKFDPANESHVKFLKNVGILQSNSEAPVSTLYAV